MEPISVPFGLTYLQAGRTTLGICTNTIENGAMVMGLDEFTFRGSRGGMSPDAFTVKMFPLSSIVWLCKFPSLAVRWYSSLSISLVLEPSNQITFVLWILCLWRYLCNLCNLWSLCLCCKVEVPLKATLASTVVLLSRLINSNVIPCCKIKSNQIIAKTIPMIFDDWSLNSWTYRLFCAMSIGTYFLRPWKTCW